MAELDCTEDERLAALRRYAILDTPPEPEFDDAVDLVKTICRVPIALVSLVDDCRQWFKAKVGVDAEETALDTSVCALAIRQHDIFVIEDLASDPRTSEMSLVVSDPKIRFYAGMPLVTSDGFALGSLCAIDVAPRPGGLHVDQVKALRALGRQVVAQIELRTAISERDKAITEQEQRQRQATRDSAILQTMLTAYQEVVQRGDDFEAVLQALVDSALDAVGPADGVVIEMRDGEDLVYRAASGSAADELGSRLPINGSLSGKCLRERTTLVTGDAQNDERTARTRAVASNIASLVVVPLTRHGRIFGVLKVRSAVPNAFASRHVLVCQMLAGLVSASLAESAETEAWRNVANTSSSYRHIVDSAIDSAIISTDAKGSITSWSKGAETIMGWREDEVLGKHFSLIFTPDDVAARRPDLELARAEAEGRASDERWHMRKDGSRFYAHGAVTPLLDESQGYVKSLRDITDEHATRTALEASRLQLDTALETGLIAFFRWDVRERCVFGDARFAEFYGLSSDAVADGVSLDLAFGRVFPSDLSVIEDEIERIVEHCEDYSHSYRVLRSDGRTRWMLVHGRCVEEQAGRPITYVGTAVDVTLQRDAEERLRTSRERLELATRAAQLGSFDYQPQSGLLEWDDRCRALFGLPPGSPVSYETSFLGGLHPDDREQADAAVRAALDPAGSRTFDVEYRTIGIEDGVVRSLLAKGLALFADGVAIRLIGTVQDVTADRNARARLAEAEERFRLALRATNDAIWDWDLRRDHVLWNEALDSRYGHAPDSIEPTGAWWLSQIHPEDRERVDRSIHAIIAGDDTDWQAEYRFGRGNGTFADVRDRGYVIRDEHGRAIRMLGALLDQTERKAIERDLKARNETLETSVTQRTEELNRLWETSPDLLAVLSLTGVLLRVNPAWTEVLGYEQSELLGRHVNDLVCPDDVGITEQALVEAAGGPLSTIENRYLHKDGSFRWFSWVAAPTASEIYATGRHITAEKEAQHALRAAEEQLRQSQKVEAIGQLTGGVAHDFNNLLTVIRGSADLLRREDLPEERRRRYIDAIADTADRATKLTSQLLAFARRSTLKPEVFDVGNAIRALQEMMGTLSGSMIEVDIILPDQSCFIHADPSQLDTAIVNMAVNARDAMERDGRLTIAVSTASMIPANRNHPSQSGDFVAVAITDNGSGIPADRIEQIFEPFFTSKKVGHGTGLGLSQVFGFAKQSGGEISVESTPGQGSTFTLYLPRVQAPDHRQTSPDERIASMASACVLVVEDNPQVGEFATSALAELGHFAVLAADAEQALAKLATGSASYDVVFSDVVMPGMTGIEMGQEIRRLYPHLPILLTSGYSTVLAQEGTYGFDLLAKPYSIAELATALRNVLSLY